MNRLQDRYQDHICIKPQPANSGRGNTARLRRWGVLHLALVACVLLFEIRALFLHFVGRWRANVIGTSSGYDSNLDAATMLSPAGSISIFLPRPKCNWSQEKACRSSMAAAEVLT